MWNIKNYSFLTIILLGLLLRLLYLNQHDLWFDEAISYFIAKPSLNNILISTGADNSPPLYYIFLHFWMLFFGSSEIDLRSFSLLTGMISLPIFYLLTKKLVNKPTAIIALVIMSLSPLMVYFSAEARMYSLLVLLSLLTVLFFLNLLKKLKLLNIFSFILFFTLALYTHYYSLLLFLPFVLLCAQQKGQHRIRLYLILIAPFILFVPWIKIYFLNPHPGFISTNSIIALPATFVSFVLGGTGIVTLRTFFTSTSFTTQLFLAICSIALLLFGIRGIILSYRTNTGKDILAFLIIPLIFLMIINFFLPVFSVRSTIFLAPFFYILVARGLQNLSKNIRTTSITILCLLFFSINLLYLYNPIFQGPPIKNSNNSASSLPIFHTSILTYYPYLYYQKDQSANWRKNILLTKNPLSPQTIAIIGGKESSLPITLSQFILLEITNGADKTELKKIKQTINENYKALITKQFGAITLTIYEKQKATI